VLAALFTHLGLVPIPIALAGLAIVIGARWLPRRTATGRALVQRVTSFRSYLRDVAFAASAGDRPAYPVDEYLAYAMVFGLTGQWRSAITRRTAVHAGPYLGTYVFLSPGFADHVDDFSHRWGHTLTSTPSSSSSGFGGAGGFSGGGGGGGGGGSW
jgi:uncharacterized membrane protein